MTKSIEIKQYLIGFIGSLILTIAAYLVAKQHAMSTSATAFIVLVFAVVQFSVQVYYFLHLREERKPRWKSWLFAYTLIMMLVIVFGSIWVMYNLNYRMKMSGSDMNRYMLEQNKKGF